MSTVQLILVTLFVSLNLCGAFWVPDDGQRSRSRCPTCAEDCPEALSAQWQTSQAAPSETYAAPPYPPYRPFPHPVNPRSLGDPCQPYPHPHPFLPLNRAERSSLTEDPDKPLYLVYRGDVEPYAPGEADFGRPLSDRELEEVVTRAIIAARRQTESQNALYRQNPFLHPKAHLPPNFAPLREPDAPEEPLDVPEPPQPNIQQLLLLRQLEAARNRPAQLPQFFPQPAPYGGVPNHWQDGELMDPEEYSGVERVDSDEVDKPEEETQQVSPEPKAEEPEKIRVDPTLVEDIEAPPTATPAPAAATPEPPVEAQTVTPKS